MTREDIVKGLKAAVIHLCLTGFTTDEMKLKRIEEMCNAINAAIDILEGVEVA